MRRSYLYNGNSYYGKSCLYIETSPKTSTAMVYTQFFLPELISIYSCIWYSVCMYIHCCTGNLVSLELIYCFGKNPTSHWSQIILFVFIAITFHISQWYRTCSWYEFSKGFNLTHSGRDKMAGISQMTVWNVFSWMKMYQFRLRFYWSCFQRSN